MKAGQRRPLKGAHASKAPDNAATSNKKAAAAKNTKAVVGLLTTDQMGNSNQYQDQASRANENNSRSQRAPGGDTSGQPPSDTFRGDGATSGLGSQSRQILGHSVHKTALNTGAITLYNQSSNTIKQSKRSATNDFGLQDSVRRQAAQQTQNGEDDLIRRMKEPHEHNYASAKVLEAREPAEAKMAPTAKSLTQSAKTGNEKGEDEMKAPAQSQNSLLQFVQNSSERNKDNSNIVDPKNSSQLSMTGNQVQFQLKASSQTSAQQLNSIRDPEKNSKLPTERPRPKLNPEQLLQNQQDQDLIKDEVVPESQPDDQSRRMDPISQSMASIKQADVADEESHKPAGRPHQSSSFKFAQNEAAKKIWDQSNYSSAYTNKNQAASSMGLGGRLTNSNQEQLFMNIKREGVQQQSERRPTDPADKEITVGQQSITVAKEKLPLSPRFKQSHSSGLMTQDGGGAADELPVSTEANQPPLSTEANEVLNRLSTDQAQTAHSDVTLYGNRGQQEHWTFQNMQPFLDQVIVKNTEVKRPRNVSLTRNPQKVLLNSKSNQQNRGSSQMMYQNINRLPEVRSQSQMELNSVSIKKLLVHDERVKKMEEQFKARFEHHCSLLENPERRIDEYMQKKKYLWLNKSLKKFDNDFRNNRSLIGLRALDSLNPDLQAQSIMQMNSQTDSHQALYDGPSQLFDDGSQHSLSFISVNQSFEKQSGKKLSKNRQSQLWSLQRDVTHLKQSYDNLKQENEAKKKSIAGVFGMQSYGSGKTLPRQGKHITPIQKSVDEKVTLGLDQSSSVPYLAQRANARHRQLQKLPKITMNVHKAYAATDVQPSEREDQDSILQSHLQSANSRQPRHHSYTKKGAIVSGMLAAKRNINYFQDEADKKSQSIVDDSILSGYPAQDRPMGTDSSQSNFQQYIKKLKTIQNMPAEQKKSPQIRRLLQEYNQISSVSPGHSYFDKGSQSMMDQRSLSKLDSMFGSRAQSGSKGALNLPANADSDLHFLIKSNMKREYARQKKERKRLLGNQSTQKLPKPEMSEVGMERFKAFQEEIRQDLYNSEDYIFANVKELRRGLPEIGASKPEHVEQSNQESAPKTDYSDAQKNERIEVEYTNDLDITEEQMARSFREKNLSVSSEEKQAEDPKQSVVPPTAAGGFSAAVLAAKDAEERRLERETYVKTIRMIMTGIIDILEILKKPPEKRSREQNMHLAAFLAYKVDFFHTDEFFDAEFMHDVAEKVEARVYQQNDVIMRKGEVGDRLFVSVKGQLGVYLSDSPDDLKKAPTALIKEFRIVGEKSLQYPKERRSATVVCLDKDETICITLTRQDYKKLINRQALVASRKRYQYLTKHVPELFGTWTRAKITELNESFVNSQLFRTGDLVYDIGQPAEVFFIVREGKLELETVIEMETAYKLPVDTRNWEVKRTTKTMQYHIRHISEGDYFGHEEILAGLTDRKSRVKCKSACKVFLINKEDMLRQFPKDTLLSIADKHCLLINLDYIVKNITKYTQLRKQQNQAILDALNINPAYHTSEGRKEQQQQGQDVAEYKRIERVKPWLRQAQQNVTNSSKIISEINRVKILDVKHSQYTVPRSHISTKEDERKFEESLRTRASYIKNKYQRAVDAARGEASAGRPYVDGVNESPSIGDPSLYQGSLMSSQASPDRDEQIKIQYNSIPTSARGRHGQGQSAAWGQATRQSPSDIIQTSQDAEPSNGSQRESAAAPRFNDTNGYMISDPERLGEKQMSNLSKRLKAKNYVHQQNMRTPMKKNTTGKSSAILQQSQTGSQKSSNVNSPYKGTTALASAQSHAISSIVPLPAVPQQDQSLHLQKEQSFLKQAFAYQQVRKEILEYEDPKKLELAASQQVIMANPGLQKQLNKDLEV